VLRNSRDRFIAMHHCRAESYWYLSKSISLIVEKDESLGIFGKSPKSCRQSSASRKDIVDRTVKLVCFTDEEPNVLWHSNSRVRQNLGNFVFASN